MNRQTRDSRCIGMSLDVTCSPAVQVRSGKPSVRKTHLTMVLSTPNWFLNVFPLAADESSMAAVHLLAHGRSRKRKPHGGRRFRNPSTAETRRKCCRAARQAGLEHRKDTQGSSTA